VLNYLGRRGQAVEIIGQLIRENKTQNTSVPELPFLLPIPELDSLPVHTDFGKWLTVRTVESWIALKNVSTYFCGEEELSLLSMLDKNPEAESGTKRKGILASKLHGIGIEHKLSFNFHLNHWFWEPLANNMDETSTSNKINPAFDLKNLPSEIIDAKVKVNGSDTSDPVTIKIPKREVFRLNNIFQKNEYGLPKGVNITEKSVIVDVGANVGAFAIYAHMWNSNANIYCFEPNPQVIPLLELNTQHFPNIERNYSALGETGGELSLYQHPYNTGESTTSQQIAGGKKVKVEVRNSGKFLSEKGISEIDVLKIDTEGAEVPILAGLKDFLPYTKVVMLEYHTEEDRRKIDEMLSGFQLYSADVQELWGIGTVKYINRKLLNN
jgi:FkbM family methyltransferase